MSSIVESYDDITKSMANYKAPKQILKRRKSEGFHISKYLKWTSIIFRMFYIT